MRSGGKEFDMSTRTRKKSAKQTDQKSQPDLVVFAFRLTQEERNAIHKAAGPAKASKFVRALVNAAATGNEQAVLDLVKATKAA